MKYINKINICYYLVLHITNLDIHEFLKYININIMDIALYNTLFKNLFYYNNDVSMDYFAKIERQLQDCLIILGF